MSINYGKYIPQSLKDDFGYTDPPPPAPVTPSPPAPRPMYRQRPKVKTPGLLETPGEAEQWWTENKDRLSGPLQSENYYNGLMGRTGGAGLQPAATSEAYNASKSYFQNPTLAETTAGRNVGELASKGYSEQLYEAGGDHLNPYYERARQKGMQELQDRMAAAGVFGSGATAKAMFELEGELGAAQAKAMADLANQADLNKVARFGESRLTATAGTDAQRNRYGDWFDAGEALDKGLREDETFNRDTAAGVDDARIRKDESVFGMAKDTQKLFEGREGGKLPALQDLADRYAGIFERMSGISADEQLKLAEGIIQSIVAGGQMDRAEAEQWVEEMMRGAGIAVQSGAFSGGGSGSSAIPPPKPNPY